MNIDSEPQTLWNPDDPLEEKHRIVKNLFNLRDWEWDAICPDTQEKIVRFFENEVQTNPAYAIDEDTETGDELA